MSYGTIKPVGRDRALFAFRRTNCSSLSIIFLGLLCSLAIFMLKFQVERVSVSTLTIGPGSVLSVGSGQDNMKLTVDSSLGADGFVHVHSFKGGIKYAGLVKLTPKSTSQKRYRDFMQEKRSLSPANNNFRSNQVALNQRSSTQVQSRRYRTGQYEVEHEYGSNLTTYLVEVQEPPSSPCSSASCPPASWPCSVGGCDVTPSSMIQHSTSSIQNQKTVNVNMIGFAGRICI